jgi:nitrite reductase/ring-hydroxylating ferredoxin subunit
MLVTDMPVLCNSAGLAEGQAQGVHAAGRDIVVVRRYGHVHAYINRCPHSGVNLEWLPDQFLDSSGEYLQCALHGALFRITDGHCVHGPCAGDALQPIAVVEQDGQIRLAQDGG